MSTCINNIESNNDSIKFLARALSLTQRQEIAIAAIKEKIPISHMAEENGVSRKFIYQQKNMALEAISEAFSSNESDESSVLFYLPITKMWIRHFVLALILICHSSFRGVCEILGDLFGINLSIGSVHNIVENASVKAKEENSKEKLSSIRVGANDEIFQNGDPVLVGCDAHSTYCYALELAVSRDEETWGIALLNAAEKGLNPDYTIADAGKGLRAGHKLAWPDKPCYGDVFHPLRDLGSTSIYLDNRAYGVLTALGKIEKKIAKAKKTGCGNKLSAQLGVLRKESKQAIALADDVRILLSWMQNDILSLVGPDLKTREELFDFVVDELRAREGLALHRIASIRRGLENQKNDLLQFTKRIDEMFTWIASEHEVDKYQVYSVFFLDNLSMTQTERFNLEAKVRKCLNHRFYSIQETVRNVTAQIVRASSVVENLNSRLRNYFFLRKQIGPSYLELLRFFLNHHKFQRSEHPDFVGKSPKEILTKQPHIHWLHLLNPISNQLAA